MGQEFFHGLYIGCGIFAIIMLLLAVALFFLLKIYTAFLFLTGIGRKRALREMEENAEFTSNLRKKGRGRKKAAAAESETSAPGAEQYNQPAGSSGFYSVGDSGKGKTNPLEEAGTALLQEEQGTQFLQEEQETQLLSTYEAAGETQLLQEETHQEPVKKKIRFVLERNIMLVHTDEVI